MRRSWGSLYRGSWSVLRNTPPPAPLCHSGVETPPVERLSGGEDSDDYAVIAPRCANVREVLATSPRETAADIEGSSNLSRWQHYFRQLNSGPPATFQQASMRWYVLNTKRSL